MQLNKTENFTDRTFNESLNNRTNYQASPGDLKQICRDQPIDGPNSVPPKEDEKSTGFLETRHLEWIDKSAIKQLDAIPNFITPCTDQYPHLLKVDDHYWCYDGYDLLADGSDKIQCIVLDTPHANETEAAILKVATRTKTEGGSATYPELIKAVKHLRQLLLNSNLNLKEYAHGGCRKGNEFSGNREDDVVSLIVNRIGKSRQTVLQCLNHAKYLDDETLDAMAHNGVTKRKIEKLQSQKRQLIKRLEEQELPESKITEKVSSSVIDWIKKTNPQKDTSASSPSISDDIDDDDIDDELKLPSDLQEAVSTSDTSPATFNHYTPDGDEPAEIPFKTMDDIKDELVSLGTEMRDMGNSDIPDIEKLAEQYQPLFVRCCDLNNELDPQLSSMN